MNILSSYLIHEDTIALLPTAHTDYYTRVYEKSRQLLIRKTPLDILRATCLEDCTTYEGRRAAIMHHTGYKRKVPMMIRTAPHLFLFPTRSPSDFSCKWIMFHHVSHIQPYENPKNPAIQSIITFQNGTTLELEESYYTIEKQLFRTNICRMRFSSPQSKISI